MTALTFDDIIQSYYMKNQALVTWRVQNHTWRGRLEHDVIKQTRVWKIAWSRENLRTLRMDLSTKSRVLMVVKVPKKLIKWWKMFNYVDQQKLIKILGNLTELLHVTPRPDLIEALLTFWDPSSLVFRFRECEMTSTLAEISGLLHLLYIEKDMIRA
ncbi:hypothetical protein FXO37_00351 [Capsicum annuum]|nr:hypothetical protein FXO37_00351 [Capsicum annuum]